MTAVALGLVAELPGNLCYMLVNGNPGEVVAVEFIYMLGTDDVVHQTRIDADSAGPS